MKAALVQHLKHSSNIGARLKHSAAATLRSPSASRKRTAAGLSAHLAPLAEQVKTPQTPEQILAQRTDAAIRVQAAWRGYKTRTATEQGRRVVAKHITQWVLASAPAFSCPPSYSPELPMYLAAPLVVLCRHVQLYI